MKKPFVKTNRGEKAQPFIVTAVLLLSLFNSFAIAQKKQKDLPLIPALNAYSFSDLLSAKDAHNNLQVYTLFNLLDWCAAQKIKALDPTAYFFPTYPEVPTDEYLLKFKNRAAELGIVISGTGIRNNFASPDPKVRAEGVELARNWIITASKMGAPVVRLFAGEIPKGYEDKWEEVAGWMIDCYKQCAVFAEKYCIKIGIQNHGDMLQTAAQCIYVLKAVNSKWVGLIIDTGNFKTADPYQDIAEVVPYAVNWQIKESVFGLGNEVPTDFKRLVKIIKDGGYKGYLPIETLLVKGKPYDPFTLVPQMLQQLTAAINEAYQ
ncbi:sugar phosphate isomerase/epimerase [Panacibacter ginsenosidivorans]|uniref:Sugar phosphate isomerase/epimerase n=1 Tax=Panacibacter ginsenosidivorans TaxID=1813871 RepID=A0A5B8V9X8_9BACT|nr:sugar phosphate isomerase/epimerase family protein [Panacibacter ginsenosidivorans]QEC68320.1 sugar phosphate isomerase/epimerase [Panacibacter ginsenosidivorans]